MADHSKRRWLAAVLAAAAIGGAQAAGPLDEAAACLETERFEACLAQVDKLETKGGRSPRLESIRAIALDQLGRTAAAYRSLLVYTELTRRLSLSDDPAHQALIAMRDRLKTDLAREFEARKSGLDAERQKAADLVVREAAVRQDTVAKTLQREHQATSQRLLTQAYARAPDKAAFEARMQAEGVDPKKLRSQIHDAAAATAANSKASLAEVLSRFAGRSLPFHPFPHPATDGMTAYVLQKVSLDGFTVDYSATGVDARGRELKESGTVQGLDLSKVRRYSSTTEGERTVHLFEFDQPVIWRRGAARYADGSPFAGELTSWQGERQFRLQTPAGNDEITALMRTLIDAAKTGAALK
jgi:hypothetical protein